MKVTCIKLISPVTLVEVESGPWASVGSEYLVLEINSYPERTAWFRILADGGLPELLPATMFETIAQQLPSNWAVSVTDGFLKMGPAPWLRVGFWEEFFDGRVEAVSEYRSQLDLMLKG